MVNKCGVPKCRSGYDGKIPPGVSMHSFPTKDLEIRKQWVTSIGKPPSWAPSPNSVICSLHFHPTDFTLLSSDLNTSRRRKHKDVLLKRRRLLPNVVPSVFQVLGGSDIKSYQSLEDIQDELKKLGHSTLPKDVFVISKEGESLHFLGLTFDKSSIAPKINYSLNVFSDLTYSMMVGEQMIQENLCKSSRSHISSFMALNDALNLLKNSFLESKPHKGTKELEMTLIRIKKSVSLLPESDKRRNKLLFILEQLDCILHSREKYSKSLIMLGVLWNNVAPRLYRSLSNSYESEMLLMLPPIPVIRSHTELPIQKLKDRYSRCSSDAEKMLSLLITENVSSSYSGIFKSGKYSTHGHRRTLLDFCIKGIHEGNTNDNKEPDIHRFVSLSDLNCIIIRDKVFELIETCTKIGFKIVSLVLDIGSNFHEFYTRELFEESSNGFSAKSMIINDDHERFIENPYDDTLGNKIYVIFNPKHCVQSLLDHWIEQNTFECPPFQGVEMSNPEIMKIEELFQQDSSQNKYNYRRSELRNPNNIFNELILSSLKKGPTYEFVKVILKFSKITQELKFTTPIWNAGDSRIQFLREFYEWITAWELRVTSSGIADLMCYLFENNGNVIDISPGRFSCQVEEIDSWKVYPFNHRSLIGLVSILTNKKRIINIKGLISLVGSEMENLDIIFNYTDSREQRNYSCNANNYLIDEKVSSIIYPLEEEDLYFKPTRENDLVYILAGFIAESLLQTLDCDSPCQGCFELLVNIKDAPTLIFEDCSARKDVELAFANTVSEKGMSAPSQLVFACCLIIRKIYIGLNMIIETKMNIFEETARMINASCDSTEKHPFKSYFKSLCDMLYDVFSCNSFRRKRKILNLMPVCPPKDIKFEEEQSSSNKMDSSKMKEVSECKRSKEADIESDQTKIVTKLNNEVSALEIYNSSQ
ncbi:unnamed protein product [Lepeophtheirus salmonis]|uniref:(salmon louse) hypothetical protein n=1 Tax=Lepeophtheirus salmonis TaxID=72036 RepID=A0A7R8CZ14_LEPSM|nr:unnamed protein product [Lepeophtheirus salmonis]CAF2972953.1 unnamed protein product [Lepeophtheirus salmonis]